MKTLEATVSSWGKSTAIRIPSALVKRCDLRVGQTVKLDSAEDGSITIRAVVPRPNLDQLLASVTPENMPDEADFNWGKASGTEVW